ncbi:MAG: single-stranded-DNA-specific exonuclease RecJ [Candidatus Omnitrophota bacterium]
MKWEVYEPNPRLQKVLAESLGVSAACAQILTNRGLTSPEAARDFLFGGLFSCVDPFLMKDMASAVERIHAAVKKSEKILIYGDYDVDGVTSTALLADIFAQLGAEYETFIPNRIDEGYGLNENAVVSASERGIKLIVTVDCGISAVREVERANELGIDVIITDHHEVKGGNLPPAYAIIDPHQADCGYPFNYLAGVGVAYKLARALMKGREYIVEEHLDLVALGTIADIVPLNGENRVLTKSGLLKLKNSKRPGLKALMDLAGIDSEKITSRYIGFALAPRINAMGRVGSADVSLELLTCKCQKRAGEIAQILDRENKNRQAIEKDILKQALARAKDEIDLDSERVIVLASDSWHAGVIGIVASRLTEEYSKPVILIALKEGMGKGSGRGVEGFNLFGAVDSAKEYLLNFGGHKEACGIRIKEEDIEHFRKKINETAKEYFEKESVDEPRLKIDYSLPFSLLSKKFVNELNALMPHGHGNREPIFSSNRLTVKNTPRTIGRNGLKFLVSSGSIACEAVHFGKKFTVQPRQGDIIDLAYTLSINTWNNVDSIQLNIEDLQQAK